MKARLAKVWTSPTGAMAPGAGLHGCTGALSKLAWPGHCSWRVHAWLPIQLQMKSLQSNATIRVGGWWCQLPDVCVCTLGASICSTGPRKTDGPQHATPPLTGPPHRLALAPPLPAWAG